MPGFRLPCTERLPCMARVRFNCLIRNIREWNESGSVQGENVPAIDAFRQVEYVVAWKLRSCVTNLCKAP